MAEPLDNISDGGKASAENTKQLNFYFFQCCLEPLLKICKSLK